MKNNGKFLKVHKIENSVAIDEMILPNDFIKPFTLGKIMAMNLKDFKLIKDKPVYMIKDEETSQKIEKLLGK